jgi:hypothetical protein
LFLRAAAA